VTTKLHAALTAEGHFVEGLPTGGDVHDVSVANDPFQDAVGCFVVEDKGYDSDEHRQFLTANNNIPVIPGRKNRKIPIIYDKKKRYEENALKYILVKSRKTNGFPCVLINLMHHF